VLCPDLSCADPDRLLPRSTAPDSAAPLGYLLSVTLRGRLGISGVTALLVQPTPAAAQEVEQRNTPNLPMMVAGIALVDLGVTGSGAGALQLALAGPQECEQLYPGAGTDPEWAACAPDPKNGIGDGLLAAGIVISMDGLPFWLIGALGTRKDGEEAPAATLVVGPAKVGLVATF
jgi:hypothetical protein